MALQEIPKILIDKIQKKNIVLFVGAGLSTNVGLPNWKNLLIEILKSLIDREEKAEGFITSLESNLFEPIDILNKIEHLKSFVIEDFEKIMRKYKDVEPSNLHRKITNLSTKIITTNYDELIEKSDSRLDKITYNNTYKTSKISEYENYVFKIHGDINEPDRCILFPSQYEEIYGRDEKVNTFELKKIISDKSILFIGFSLSDPYINYIFNYISRLLSGFTPEHFIITTDSQKDWPDRITPILINDFSELEEIINSIIEKSTTYEVTNEIEKPTIIEDSKNAIITYHDELEYDIPPDIKLWVGRKKEIENISNDNFKTIFITGIGGQGKSALAANFIKNYFKKDIYEFGDWRDFKEETNRFQTKILSIIKRLNNGKIPNQEIDKLSNKDLVDSFFYYLADRKIIFVFDNIDSYIDLENFIPTGDIGYLFKECLNRNHNSKFIFTCRPFIKEAGVDFYQIKLSGLSVEESLELFQLYKINITTNEIENFNLNAHTITKGHPLWLNLIAAQAIRGIDTAKDFLLRIENKTNFSEENFSSILSQKILKQVWESLNIKQQTLLCGIAETVKPETINNLKQILKSKFNNNQFDRAINTLKNLNLIETKSSSISENQIELHPLVKEFIINKYPRGERAKYITLLVKYYDNFIYILKPKLNSKLPLTSFQNWTSKIELEVNKEDFKPALIALHEVGSSILTAGFSEEYIRVSVKLYDTIDWSKAIDQEYPYFHSELISLITILIQLGKYETSNEYLDKYENTIPGKSSHYLAYCSQKCYLNWFQENFEEAIMYGEKGEFLLTNSGLPDNYSLFHNLALARRDSKNEEKINLSLSFFLNGEDLNTVINPHIFIRDLGGHYYGNIGRCLEFLDREDDAFICYFKAMKLLFVEDSEYYRINLGYSSFWISNILLKKHKIQDGLIFLKLSMINWEQTAPPRLIKLKESWDNVICDVQTKNEIEKKAEWQIEKHCKNKIDEVLKITSTKE